VIGTEVSVSVASRAYGTCEGLSYLPLDLPSYLKKAGPANVHAPHQCVTPDNVLDEARKGHHEAATGSADGTELADADGGDADDAVELRNLSMAKREELRAMFQALDMDGDGQLSMADANGLLVDSHGSADSRQDERKNRLAERLRAVRNEIMLMVDDSEQAVVTFEEYVRRLVTYSADFG